MKLSEAIRLGTVLRPQAREFLFDMVGGSCALGAAAEAIGLNTEFSDEGDTDDDESGDIRYKLLRQRFPLLDLEFSRPVDSDVMPMRHIIPTLNDTCGWTREAIAEFVESIERQSSPSEAAEPVELAEVGRS